MVYVLILGEVINGLQFIGPFDSEIAALNYGEEAYPNEMWVVGSLQKPEDTSHGN